MDEVSVASPQSSRSHTSSSLKSHAMVRRIDLMEDSRWRTHWAPEYGRYYFEDHHTGETRWDPPPVFEKAFPKLPEIRRLEHTTSAEHSAACMIQRFFKKRVVPWQNQKLLAGGQVGHFEKHLDEASGRYYYVNEDGETSWDAPAGSYPLQPLPKERIAGLKLEKAMREVERREASIERTTLLQIRREDYEKEKRERRRQNKSVEKSHEQQVWMDAFSIAGETQELQVSWQKLGTMHPDIARFKQRYGMPLQGLRLVGHELEKLSTDFGKGLQSLTALSLASNRLEMLPDGICRLTNLKSLNLLRNRLRMLPSKTGELVQLEELYVSSNRLESIPSSFGNLMNLPRVDLSANRLKRLPDSLQRLACYTFVCNGNLLTSISPSICKMKHLKKLSLCENLIKYLPREIGDFGRLETLYLLGNRLMELPDTLGKLTTLKKLWLGMNNLTSLPWNFYQLTNLQQLSLEGCPDMVHPTHKYLSRGPQAVINWSEDRWKHAKYVRRQTICMTLQNLFEQLDEEEDYFGRGIRAYFEPDTEYDDQTWFALAIPQFNYVKWSINLRRLFTSPKDASAEDEGAENGADESAAVAVPPTEPVLPKKEAKKEEQVENRLEKLRKQKLAKEKLLGWKPLMFPGGDEKLALQPRPEDQDEAPPGGTPRKGDASDSDDDDDSDDENESDRGITDKEKAERAKKEEEKRLEDLQKETPVETMTVGEVVEGSNAAKAGLRVGQKIIGVGAVGLETVYIKSHKHLLSTLKEMHEDGIREVEVKAEVEGKTGFFWEFLLPKLEEYWRAGHDDPEGVDVPKKYVQNFPFERDEVDRVLRTFKDPWGPVCITAENTLFRRCSCIQEDGRRRVCVPPKQGYMCSRTALLFKSEVKLKRHKVQHDRRVREKAQVDAMVEIAREQAQAWVRTEDGKKYIRELASKKVNDVMDAKRKQRWEGKVDEGVARKIRSLDNAYVKKRSKLETKRDEKEGKLRMKRQMLEESASVEVGLAKEMREKEADEIQKQIEELPETKELMKLTDDHNKRIDELVSEFENKGSKAAGLMQVMKKTTQMFGGEYWRTLRELEVDILDQYIKRECRKAREEKEQENRNLQKIASAWNGVAERECFRGWKKYTQRELNQRARDEARGRRQRFEAIQIPKATIKIARFKVRSWGNGDVGRPKPQIDLWTDKPYWVHQETGEQRWSEPTTEEYLPKDFVMPDEYKDLDDEELDQIDMDEDKGFEEVELPYPDVDLPTPRAPLPEEKGMESDSDEEGDSEEEGEGRKKKNLVSLDELDPEDGAEEDHSALVVRSQKNAQDSSDDDDEEEEGRSGGVEEEKGREIEDSAESTRASTAGSASGTGKSGDELSTLLLEDEASGALVKKEGNDKVKKSKADLEDLQLIPRPKTPMGYDEAVEPAMDEAAKALVRMRARRERAVERARSEQAKVEAEMERRAALLVEEREAEDAEKERKYREKVAGGPAPGRDVGFDPNRVYTNKELTRMAQEQIAMNKARGQDANGNPIKVIDVDRTLEEYGFDVDRAHERFNNFKSLFGMGSQAERERLEKKKARFGAGGKMHE